MKDILRKEDDSDIKKIAERVATINKEQHDEIMDAIRLMNEKLDPVYETYSTVIRLGTWAKWAMGFILLILGVYAAFREAFNR